MKTRLISTSVHRLNKQAASSRASEGGPRTDRGEKPGSVFFFFHKDNHSRKPYIPQGIVVHLLKPHPDVNQEAAAPENHVNT